MLRIILVLAALASSASAQYCELVGYEIWGQDDPAFARGTFLGEISTSKYDQYSIMNESGVYGSFSSPKSISNELGKFGDKYSNTSGFNNLATKPPIIWEYRPATNTYYRVGYLTNNTTLSPRYNASVLFSVLAYGKCAGCAPVILYDTVRIHDTTRVTLRDTVIKRDTLRLHDTTRVVLRDTVIKTDTLKIYDTTKVTLRDTLILHDTTRVVLRDTVVKIDSVKYCPASAARRTAPGRQSSQSHVFDISGRFWATCKE